MRMRNRHGVPKTYGAATVTPTGRDEAEFARAFAALQGAHQTWVGASAYSAEARLVADALGLTIGRINKLKDEQPPSTVVSFTPSPSLGLGPEDPQLPSSEFVAAMMDGTEYIDWGLFDQYFHDSGAEGSALDSWAMDAEAPVDVFPD